MAKVLSGSFNTTAYSNRYLTFTWSATQDINKNQSTISWTLKGAGAASGYYMAGNFKVVIAGATVYESATRIQLYNDTIVASGTKVITHNTNGTQSFSASVQAGIYTVAVNCSGNGSWELKDIPRGATITSAPNFTDEDTPLIKISNPAGAVTQAGIFKDDGTTALIPYRAFSGSEFTFMFDDDEKLALQKATTTSNTLKVRFYVKSTIGTQNFWTYTTKTLTIANCKPVLAPTVADSGSVSQTLINTGTMIKGYNTMVATINATARKQATIKSVKITNGSVTKTTASATFGYTENNVFTFSATDSRGNTTTQTITVPMIDYVKPTCVLTKNTVSTSGEYVVAVKGQFFNGSFGKVTNTLTVQFMWREHNGMWSDWQTLNATKSGNTYTAEATVTGLDYKKSYDIQARAADVIEKYNATTDVYTVTSVPVFSWDKDDFRHNTHVQLDNAKAIYGTSTSGGMWAALEPCTSSNVTSLGWGSYSNSLGRTEVWGNNVNITAKGNVNINGRAYGTYKVLATTAWFMADTQTLNLSEAISKQPNGIVLIFSLYRNNAAENVSLHSFFISKYDIAMFNGAPHTFMMGINGNMSVFGAKYLYIYDTYIKGHSNNTTVGASTCGIQLTNNNFVLRAVIGV